MFDISPEQQYAELEAADPSDFRTIQRALCYWIHHDRRRRPPGLDAEAAEAAWQARRLDGLARALLDRFARAHGIDPAPVATGAVPNDDTVYDFEERVSLALRALRELEAPEPLAPARHSIDFRSVHWFGTDYCFTAGQAACVAVLWAAWENGTPDVSQEATLDTAGDESRRLSALFARHPSWGTMIVGGGSKGAFRLQPP
jgi:hypothetical protein